MSAEFIKSERWQIAGMKLSRAPHCVGLRWKVKSETWKWRCPMPKHRLAFFQVAVSDYLEKHWKIFRLAGTADVMKSFSIFVSFTLKIGQWIISEWFQAVSKISREKLRLFNYYVRNVGTKVVWFKCVLNWNVPSVGINIRSNCSTKILYANR